MDVLLLLSFAPQNQLIFAESESIPDKSQWFIIHQKYCSGKEKIYINLCLGFIFFQSKINQSLKFKSNSGSFSILLQNFWSLVDGGIPTDRVKSNVNIVYAFPPRKIENMKHLRIENKFCQTKHNQTVNVYCSHLSSSLCQQLNA